MPDTLGSDTVKRARKEPPSPSFQERKGSHNRNSWGLQLSTGQSVHWDRFPCDVCYSELEHAYIWAVYAEIRYKHHAEFTWDQIWLVKSSVSPQNIPKSKLISDASKSKVSWLNTWSTGTSPPHCPPFSIQPHLLPSPPPTSPTGHPPHGPTKT